MLEGLLELKSNDCFETVEKIKTYVAGCEKAKAAAENLGQILKLVMESGCPCRLLSQRSQEAWNITRA